MLVWIHQNPGRFRSAARAIAVFFALGGACAWVFAPSGSPVRDLINRTFTSYDGCRCEECLARYLVIPPPQRGFYMCCRPPMVDPGDALAWGSGLASAGCLGLGLWLPGFARRSVERAAELARRCPRCGYSKDGLTRDVCPECGGALPQGAGGD